MNKLITLGSVLLICALLGACSTDSGTKENETGNSVATESVATTEQSTDADLHFSTMEEYVEYVLSDADEENFKTDIMTYKIYAEQDTLVYDYVYNQQYENIAEIKSNLDASYDPENESVQNLLSDLRKNIDIDNPKIKYIYRNNDGSVISEYVFE